MKKFRIIYYLHSDPFNVRELCIQSSSIGTAYDDFHECFENTASLLNIFIQL